LVLVAAVDLCSGHGHMSRPSARNAIWQTAPDDRICPYSQCRPTQPNYDLNGLSAGGPAVVYEDCRFVDPGCVGKFGLCGDRYDANPQNHLENGKFGSGLVNAVYEVGQTVYITLTITVHHYGYHEFDLYVHPDTNTIDSLTTDKLTHYPLKLKNPVMEHTTCRHHIIDPLTQWCMPPTTAPLTYYLEYELPAGVHCKRCVLQWHWVTANSLPPSNPEEFWNCADITIASEGPYFNNEWTNEATPGGDNAGGTTTGGSTTGGSTTGGSTSGGGTVCKATPGSTATDAWCQATNCAQEYVDAGYCEWVHDHGGHQYAGYHSEGGGGYVPVTGGLVCSSNPALGKDYLLCKKIK